MQPSERIEVADLLGECVLWDEPAQALWWTDIEGRVLHRLDWPSRRLESFATPRRLASFGLLETGRELIAAFDNGFAVFDPASGAVTDLAKPEGLTAGIRLNDGKVDRRGRFWAGSMMETDGAPSAARLYCLNDGRIESRLQGIGIANGLCWSPDGTVCYFADSREKAIWRFAFEAATGVLSDCRPFAVSPAGVSPDGATVDAEGYVWSAQWGGAAVIRYAPDGRIDRVVDVPVAQPTSVAFGGPELNLLFVASARLGAPAQTGAGDLFVYNAPVRGLPENRCKIGHRPQIAGQIASLGD
jgi:L-arabinonolactonase